MATKAPYGRKQTVNRLEQLDKQDGRISTGLCPSKRPGFENLYLVCCCHVVVERKR
jgi:hypothetical protein